MPEPQEARKAVIAPDREDQFGAVRLWLYAMAALVLAMIIVGGATRLTDSGLSITEWQPLLGVIPPLTEADWHDAFAKYKQIPQYQLVNKGMSLDEFKFIYWWSGRTAFSAVSSGLLLLCRSFGSGLAGSCRKDWHPSCLECWRSAQCRGALAGSW